MTDIQYPENGKKNVKLTATDLCGNTRNGVREVNIIQRLLEGQYINIVEDGDKATISADVSADYYNKAQINELMGDLDTVKFKIVNTLPAVGAENVIYLVPKVAPEVGYDQYIWDADAGTFYPIGDTDIDLSEYYTKLQADEKFQEILSNSSAISNVTDTTDFSQVSLGTKTVRQATGLSIWNYIKSKMVGAISSVILSDLGTSKAMATTSDGKIGATLVTTDELYTLRGSDITKTLQAQIDEIRDEMWKKIYPVGAIYISYSSTSPATLFGGTWTQIEGKFLVASGSASYSYVNTSGSSATGSITFTATNTGGSPRVQLTTDTMPKHQHGLPYRKCGSYSGTDWRTDPGSVDGYAGNTVAAGGGSYPTGYGAPFNQLPPYLVVYMWRRTA